MPPIIIQRSFVPGQIVKYPKPKRMKVGGWVELDYEAEIEIAPGIKFYRECAKQSDSFFSKHTSREETWHWGCYDLCVAVYKYEGEKWKLYNIGSRETNTTKREEAFKLVLPFIKEVVQEAIERRTKKYQERMKDYNKAASLLSRALEINQ